MAESLLRNEGGGRFNAFSAGSHPRGAINPFALELLSGHRLPTDGLLSKSWDIYGGSDAPRFDFVFTVCDRAAEENCPVWPGQPVTAHWGIEDPAAVEGTEAQRRLAFVQTLRYLKLRINAFTALPIESLERLSLVSKLNEIGQMEGSTNKRPNVA
jgi:arsenate reductase